MSHYRVRVKGHDFIFQSCRCILEENSLLLRLTRNNEIIAMFREWDYITLVDEPMSDNPDVAT